MLRLTRQTDYGIVLMTHMAACERHHLHNARAVAAEVHLPLPMVSKILKRLARERLLVSHRGVKGGYSLARPPQEISVADIIRVLDGPLGAVRSEAPEDAKYSGPAAHLRVVWVATRAALRSVLEQTTLADVVSGHTTPDIDALLETPGAWDRR